MVKYNRYGYRKVNRLNDAVNTASGYNKFIEFSFKILER